MTEPPEVRPEMDDSPPLLGSWRNIYLLVMGNLLLLIVVFTIITKVLS